MSNACYFLLVNIFSCLGPGEILDCNPTPDGSQYIGHKSVTVSGKQCQAWASQYPHEHGYSLFVVFPDSSITDAGNYCRNNNFGRPWCYTVDPNTLKEECEVPNCGESVCIIK